ncbi:hypothetical protein GCM10009835_33040 [Planosporangium flavigriseum]|uniref:Uncharacterized protein n=1 Tax=Planosporangium flavigriseum TaxID=373681 RepID=A0A8J3LTU8_9ACTN|nr:hypothetical protein Pfl04_50740 [Planosporangium flavigriseum]
MSKTDLGVPIPVRRQPLDKGSFGTSHKMSSRNTSSQRKCQDRRRLARSGQGQLVMEVCQWSQV